MTEAKIKRVIARHGGKKEGPLLIVIGALHGNEKAGVKAIRLLKKMLSVEPITNPAFEYRGAFVGLLGNRNAYINDHRYVDHDMNRLWGKKNVKAIRQKIKNQRNVEEHEIYLLRKKIIKQIKKFSPSNTYILDIHSTSSNGGIFTIPANDDKSLKVAKALHAPVITGMLKGVKGTTLHYFSNRKIKGSQVTAITFEAGQHEDPLSVNRTIAAIINCMKALGAVKRHDVESIHDNILINYSKNLPPLSELIYKHSICDADQFVMEPGYKNFQSIKKGERLGTDINGPITSPMNGHILMPLYQKQGAEGFYIVQQIEN